MYYRDTNGIEHEDYDAACHYYGADTPAQVAAEMAAEEEEYLDWCTDHALYVTVIYPDDDMPF